MISFIFILLGILLILYGLKKKKKFIKILPKYPQLNVYYGSQTGTASHFSKTIVQKAQSRGFKARSINLLEFKPPKQPKLDIILIATHYEGQPTDNSIQFIKYLKGKGQQLPQLQGYKVCLFSLGNSQYEKFNQIGRLVKQKVKKWGGQIVLYGQGDDNSTMQQNYKEWQQKLWEALQSNIKPLTFTKQQQQIKSTKKQIINHYTLPNSNHPFQILDSLGQPYLHSQLIHNKNKYVFQINTFASLKQTQTLYIRNIDQNQNYGQNVLVRLKSHKQKLCHHNLLLWVNNSQKHITQVLKYFQLNPNQLIDIYYQKPIQLPFPTPISIIQLLSRWVDLSSPSKQQKQIKNTIQSYIENTQRKNICFTDFINYCQIITPRYYTVCNWQSDYDQLAIKLLDYGLVSEWGRSNQNNCRVGYKENSFNGWQKYQKVLCICTGTGIAPFRSFLYQKQKNKLKVQITIIFGCRQQSSDFLFREELKQFQRNGILNNLLCAFSRDGKKEYVQDVLVKNKQLFWRILNNNGCILICGSTGMGKGVKQKMLEMIIQSNLNEQFYDELQKGKRIIRQLW